MRAFLIPSVVVVLCLAGSLATAQKKAAATSEEAAGPDFLVQGEYVGEIEDNDGKDQLGVQVIALGDGKFRGVSFPGGLPGAGWTGEEGVTAEGSTEDGATTLTCDEGSGVIRDGVLTIHDADGNKLGDLKRTIRKSPTLGAQPPEGAVHLFAGPESNWFRNSRLEDGLLREGMTSVAKFGSFKLHMEFRLSFMPQARGQGRSNSGCYMQGRYETQILDSFGLSGEHNECGGIYSVKKPDVNMCFPPLSWQTYDVDFTEAKFDADGNKTAHTRMTVRHNGVLVHDDVEVDHSTTASPLKEGPDPGPIYIQNHGNPLHFRNIWVLASTVEVDERAAPDGFVSLFDGRTLNGWHRNPEKIGHGTGGRWGVENGTIVGEQDPPGSGNGGILLTDRKFGDFELLIDMKPDWGVCSGLFLRGNNKGQCFQMMVDYHDDGNVGHIYGEGSGGFNNRPFDIVGTYDDQKKLTGLTTKPSAKTPPEAWSISGENWVTAWKLNDWNTARVRVVGNPARITTWLNGTKVSEFDGATFSGDNYDATKVSELLGTEGRIAVQVHGGTGWPKGARCRWRNIFVKELEPEN